MPARSGWLPEPAPGPRPETTVTSPMRTGSTKWTLPCTVFLSCTRRAIRLSGGDAVERRNGAVRADQVQHVEAVFGREVAGHLRPGGRRRACPRPPLRRAGSGCSAVSASSAWPKVWPKLRMRRRSPSRSSARDHFDLHAHGFGDDAVDRGGLARQHSGARVRQEGEQRRRRG